MRVGLGQHGDDSLEQLAVQVVGKLRFMHLTAKYQRPAAGKSVAAAQATLYSELQSFSLRVAGLLADDGWSGAASETD